MSYTPPFSITTRMLALVADIAEKVGRISGYQSLKSRPHLRRSGRIRSIHASLAIEANSLSLDEVKSVIDGKPVIGSQLEIQEVKNAYLAYDMLGDFDPYSLDDLKKLHGVMTHLTVQESGVFRSRDEGVFSGGRCIFMAPPPGFVPDQMRALFDWMRSAHADVHPLILSSVFHYEFVFIHPFSDGNGRMARLWQTALLSEWNPLFRYLPIESRIQDFQDDYYAAIAACHSAGRSDIFIEFMLGIIKEALTEAINEQPVAQSKEEVRWAKIAAFLRMNHIIQNVDVQSLLDVSPATASRVLNTLTKEGKLVKVRNGRYWAYKLAD